jgi:hypothetical protein
MRFYVAFILCFNTVLSQDNYPKDYFRSPVDIPLTVSGSFGELRPNHFHSGLDFRTGKNQGLPIYAVADGYISRIKISTYGYGKAIYIDHPNGFTTLYGHLQRCSPAIQKIVLDEHYKKENYEIEILPKPNEIPVKKGDIIAYSGNTGNSGGPHLHFEYRDTKTENIINPLFFGLGKELKDSIAPQINGLMVYPIGDSTQVNGSSKPFLVNLSLQKDGTYIADKIEANGKIGFSINTYDTSNSSYNKNGIYKLDTYVNGLHHFGYEFDTFSFDETHLVNEIIDYSVYKAQKQRYQKLFIDNFYPKSVVKMMKNNGLIDVPSNLNLNYKIVVQDFLKNETVVNIPVSHVNFTVSKPKEISKTDFFIKSKIEHSYVKDNVSVFIPENTFSNDFYLKFDVRNNELFLHDNSQAVYEKIKISFDVSKIPLAQREKMFIGNQENLRINYNPTLKENNTFTTYTNSLGKFILAKDDIPPTIYKPNFKDGENIDTQKTLSVSIADDLSGIKSYNGYLNGKWILMEFENKNRRLTHNLEEKLYKLGKNELKIIVKDNLGNSAVFETTFIRTK